MSVSYSQTWTVEELRSIAQGETDLGDLITRNIIKDDGLENSLVVGTVVGAWALVVKTIKEYLFFDPERVVVKIVQFLYRRSGWIVAGTTLVLYLTREGLFKAIDKLESEGHVGVIITVEFSLPTSFNEAFDIADIKFTAF